MMNDVQTQNEEGDWIPDIPLPIYHIILKRCPFPGCNQGYFSEPGYRGHYALVHICKLKERQSS